MLRITNVQVCDATEDPFGNEARLKIFLFSFVRIVISSQPLSFAPA